jgi:fructokinase
MLGHALHGARMGWLTRSSDTDSRALGTRPMILVCGEALIDMFVGVTPDGGIKTEAVAGGSPFNVAIGLRRLGCPSAFCSGLSNDTLGQFLAGRLEKEGVSLAFAPRLDKPTTLVIVSTNAKGVPTYRFIGEGAADRALRPEDLPTKLGDEVKAITFGSFSMGVEPSGSSYLELARRESKKRVISVDPNLRASVVGDLAKWRARQDAFLSKATIVKASEEDIEGTYGKSSRIDDVAASWLKLGPAMAVITRGDNGAIAFHASGKVEVPGHNVKVVDTVGAGDTFHAALLRFLDRAGRLSIAGVRGLTAAQIEEALDFAGTAASITCTRRGADLPREADVEALIAEWGANSGKRSA